MTFNAAPVFPNRRYCPKDGVSWASWGDSCCWICGVESTTRYEPIPWNSQVSLSGFPGWRAGQLDDLTAAAAP